jgi:hypothetical protein
MHRTNAKTVPKVQKQLRRKTLRHDVSELLRGRHVENPNLTERHLLTNEVDVNLDVLRTTMLNRVACHVNSADVVTEDDGRGREGLLKLEKKLTKPTALSHGVSHGSVLGLGTGARHSGLAFRGPGHQVIAKVDTVA